MHRDRGGMARRASCLWWSDSRGEVCCASWGSLGRGGKRREERFGGVACGEVAIKAVPKVEPHRLPHFAGLMATQLDVLKIALPPQRPYQRLPKGGLKEIVRLDQARGLSKVLWSIPALSGFCNGFVDEHNGLPPSQRFVLML